MEEWQFTELKELVNTLKGKVETFEERIRELEDTNSKFNDLWDKMRTFEEDIYNLKQKAQSYT